MLTNGDQTVIVQKTRELCETIVAQPEFLDLRRRIDAFMADESAKAQYQETVEQGELLQQKQQRGTALSSKEVQDFESRRDALFKNPVTKGFLDAQQEMHEVRQKVGHYVAKTFELGRVPNEEDFESCGHGCSCG